jgi:hypothetical protein
MTNDGTRTRTQRLLQRRLESGMKLQLRAYLALFFALFICTAQGASVRRAATTGSIEAKSAQLNVASATGFKVGDWVIVEIGKEHGLGRRGTRGVGGTWPAKSFETEAQLLADKTQPEKLFAWAEDTGYVFWWLQGKWFNLAPNRPNTFYTGQYYLGKAIPRSLQARVLRITGNTLTLDKVAAATTSGANVYLDTAPIINELIVDSASVTLTAGSYPLGGVVWVRNKAAFVLAGEGQDRTTLYSPKGVPSAMIQVRGSPRTVVRDLTLQGNFRDEGFGLNWTGSTPAATGNPVTETMVPQGAGFPSGILFHTGSHDSLAQDIRVIDVAQQAVGVSFADNVWARRIENVQNDLLRQYVQWQFQWADTTGGGCDRCEVRSTYVIPGFEAFKSTGVQFLKPKGTNALMALNASGGWLIEDAFLRFTPNSLHPESDRIAASPHHGVINVATNAGLLRQVAMGGTIRRTIIVQEGYLNSNNDTLQGIIVNAENPNIRIENVAYYAPDFKAPSVSNGARGLNSTGLNTSVKDILVVGKSQPGRDNVFIQRGRGENCVALVVVGC